MVEKKEGTSEIKDILKFCFELAKAIEGTVEDKKITLQDLARFIPVLLSAGEAFNDLPLLVKQFSDLDGEELKEIKEYAGQEFDLKDDKIEDIVHQCLDVSLEVYYLIKSLVKIA